MSKISEAEGDALWALDKARAEIQDQPTDRIGRDPDTGEAFGYMSSALVEQVVTDALAAEHIETDLVGVEVIGATIASSWTWRCGAWRSKETRIQLPTIHGMSPRGMVTLQRKLYLSQLLRLRVAQDPAADVANAADVARVSVYDACRELLRAYTGRHRLDEAAVIEHLIAMPQPKGARLTYEMLAAPAIAFLYARLAAVTAGESVEWDPGATQHGIEELPGELGGAG